MNAGHIITTLLSMAVLIGVFTMVVTNPSESNALLAAGTTGVTGLVKGNEQRK